MPNIYFNLQKTDLYSQACISVTPHTGLLVHTDIFQSEPQSVWATHPQEGFCFNVIAHTSLMIHTEVFIPVLQPIQSNCPRGHFLSTDIAHRLTHPQRLFISCATAYTSQRVHIDIFFPLTQPTHVYSSTQTFATTTGGYSLFLPTQGLLLSTRLLLSNKTFIIMKLILISL